MASFAGNVPHATANSEPQRATGNLQQTRDNKRPSSQANLAKLAKCKCANRQLEQRCKQSNAARFGGMQRECPGNIRETLHSHVYTPADSFDRCISLIESPCVQGCQSDGN